MGVPQSTYSLWLTNQRTYTVGPSRERTQIQKHRMCFPSYLHYHPLRDTVSYSTSQDPATVMLRLKLDQPPHDRNITLTRHPQHANTPLWREVARHQHVEVEEGDALRLGGLLLRVQELVVSPGQGRCEMHHFSRMHSHIGSISSHTFGEGSLVYQSTVMSGMVSSRRPNQSMESYNNSSAHMHCRFCFDGRWQDINPLLSVCNCAGSVRYVHLECLKQWVGSKVRRVETSHCVYYHYEQFQCELCRTVLLNELVHEGVQYVLFEAEPIHPPYLRLQGGVAGRVAEVMVRLEEGVCLGLGRHHSNEIVLSADSLGGRHCELLYTGRRLWVGREDEESVLVEIREGKRI